MKLSTIPYTLLLSVLLQGSVAMAERADREKPMNVESDALRYDDAKQISVFTGKVVLTKGTMLIRGARLEVTQDKDGNQFGVVNAEPGKLAFFRQKRDTPAGGPDEFMEGEAELIEYDGKADTVKFSRRAILRRYIGSTLNDEITGQVIVYDNTASVMNVDGGPVDAGASGRSARVRAVLTPRNDATRNNATEPKTPAAPAAPLRKSSTLGGDKK
ncbi:MAG: lipopolysaccharide transport periplasmic protein LptA [Rhodoferax sp.]|jgi:lipopolysaccharide export system protein LptA|nr:lipopolysaccharide transport periplasmic protein LptA [Rhodoferax sp.]MBP9929377.1 lipopolysaccharide transport periplasmic protein LptA [Rhodoferax sp.]HQX57729.1 lipopolysaccharide transport periplasmic protein LptA [Burkholderiaceae bacterium]HQZ05729.1 lipopolysaccharide transport periplasmic protein LptA [Burkholderiaceae bacterium]HRA61096.1 lipopolysaccharide transport periplasmic protein LptA [Burkholderiaceae bacterium]